MRHVKCTKEGWDVPKIPLEIRDVIEKPGETWSEKEKNRVLHFLFKNRKEISFWDCPHGIIK